ncbi:MAG: hypothetical protein K0B37_10410 [Bacteroidales bacterium]|nr:hypothetical protein [Bacteroidales bacterium]
MSEQNEAIKDSKKLENTKVRPTLFIAVGGTGMEIALRVRRRLLNHVWGDPDNQIRISSLTEFPLAQFVHCDLSAVSTIESGQATTTDPLANLVKFTDEERLVFPLDLDKYLRSDGELANYPHIASWFPLTGKKVRDLGIDPTQGAGQIRSLSRLYFFDKYSAIKNSIEGKVRSLLAGVSSKEKTERLQLELEPASLRVVVLASTAGGTGSGAFLDMGYLAKWIAKKQLSKARVELCLMLPSGYSGAGKSRTEANSYAALMELETCTGHGLQFVKQWAANEEPELSARPYDEVFLFDTGNVALKKTEKATDLFDMVADILFEDFTNAEFANWKRSIAANQSQHKIDSFSPPIDPQKYGTMQLRYSKSYSAFGQAIIDTQLEQKRDEIVCNQVNEMLKVFFGISSGSEGGYKVPPPSPDDGRNVLRDHVYCDKHIFTLTYDFNSDATPYKKGLEYSIPKLVDHLLYDGDKPLLGVQHDKINRNIEEILASSEKDQRLPLVDKLLNQLDRDLGLESGATDAGARGLEEAIHARRQVVFNLVKDEQSTLLKALWAAVDNKEKGGLDYTIQLIERIKDAIENKSTGLLKDLEAGQIWFSELCEKLRSGELQVLRDHYNQAKGKGFLGLGGNKEAHAEAKLQQMGEAVRWYTEARLRAIACEEAAELLRDLSTWLGEHQGLEQQTNRKRWSTGSFAGKLASYEKLIVEIMAGMDAEVVRTREATKKGHAAYQVVQVASTELDTARNLSPQKAMEWANSVLGNIGGIRVIYRKLEDEVTRAELIVQLRNIALTRLPKSGSGDNDSLIKALREMKQNNPAELKSLFQNCMDMAMPWVEANLGGTWTVKSDQYSCVIGVSNADLFEKEFGAEFREALPASAQISIDRIKFTQTGVPGKLTCYVELSGIPITSMNLLSNWRSSYNEEGKKIPVHVHKDKTLFIHPMVPSSLVLDRLAEEFKLYLQGVILGGLKVRKDGSNDHVYCLNMFGESLSIGNERTIRLEGVEAYYLNPLKDKIRESLDRMKTPLQRAALVALFDFYGSNVYPPSKVEDENHVEKLVDGFCRVLCLKLRDDEQQKLNKKTIVADIDALDLITRCKDQFEKWTDEIEGSENDVYPSEVGSAHGPKRVLKPDFFMPGWLEKVLKFEKQNVRESERNDSNIGSFPSQYSCQKCSGPITGNPKFCPECGSPEWKKSTGDKTCPFCSLRIEGNPKFCPECGKQLPASPKCSECGLIIEGKPKFCPECGNPQCIPLKCCSGCGVMIEGNPKFCLGCGIPLI